MSSSNLLSTMSRPKPSGSRSHCQAIEGRIDVATGATDLALERIVRRIERLLAPAKRADGLWSRREDGRGNAECARVDHADGVVEPVGHIQPAAIAAEREPARIVAHGNAREHIIAAG